jgi:hypothetical protein
VEKCILSWFTHSCPSSFIARVTHERQGKARTVPFSGAFFFCFFSTGRLAVWRAERGRFPLALVGVGAAGSVVVVEAEAEVEAILSQCVGM